MTNCFGQSSEYYAVEKHLFSKRYSKGPFNPSLVVIVIFHPNESSRLVLDTRCNLWDLHPLAPAKIFQFKKTCKTGLLLVPKEFIGLVYLLTWIPLTFVGSLNLTTVNWGLTSCMTPKSFHFLPFQSSLSYTQHIEECR